jgi:glutaredoxin
MTSFRSARVCLLLLLCIGIAACSSKVDQSELRKEVGSAPVVLLSTAWCGYCKKLRSSLREWGVAFEEIDVERSAKGQRAYHMLNGRGVPILLIGEDAVHGYSPNKARELLFAAGLMPPGAPD